MKKPLTNDGNLTQRYLETLGSRHSNLLVSTTNELTGAMKCNLNTPAESRELSLLNKSAVTKSSNTLNILGKQTASKPLGEAGSNATKRNYVSRQNISSNVSVERPIAFKLKAKKLKRKLTDRNEEAKEELFSARIKYKSPIRIHTNSNCIIVPQFRRGKRLNEEDAFTLFKNRKKLNLQALECKFNNSRVTSTIRIEQVNRKERAKVGRREDEQVGERRGGKREVQEAADEGQKLHSGQQKQPAQLQNCQ